MTRLWILGLSPDAVPAELRARHEILVAASVQAVTAAPPSEATLLIGGAIEDAIEACAEVRAAVGHFELPVLVLVQERAEVARALAAGASDAITAPWDDDELAARLAQAQVLARRHQADLDEARSRARTIATGAEGAPIDSARVLEQAQQDRRRAQEATRQMDDFLATVSHELRTPLTAILGWARLLVEGSLGEAARARAVTAILRSARTQARLIEDLLDVSRILAGHLRVDRVNLGLGPIVEAVVDAARVSAEAAGVWLSASLTSEPAVVRGDADRLRQIANNLLGNAVKFTPRGGRVDVTLEVREGNALLVVSDTGIGIPADFLPFVFDRFRQADTGTTRAHGGLGLGLSIARHLAAQHGGKLSAHSDGAGRGSRFELSVPLAGEQWSLDGAGSTRRGPPDLHGVRVLVVDDDEEMRALLVVALSLGRAEVEVAGDAEGALRRLRETPPDVLVSDVGMPGEDGHALAAALRALPGEQARIPAVALTAYARASDRDAALRAGFDAYLEKPLDPMQLLSTIAELARRGRAVSG